MQGGRVIVSFPASVLHMHGRFRYNRRARAGCVLFYRRFHRLDSEGRNGCMNSGSKYVYDFAQGGAGMKELLGGKGANLSEMVSLGIPVPSGFIITTEACIYYSETGGYPEGLETEIDDHLKTLESEAGKDFGDREDPLLVSVRSGAVVSMPGMMDTVLNLGLNDVTVKGLAESTGNPRFAYDSYRRFIQMFGEVVMRVEGQIFEDALIAKKAEVGAVSDTELLAAGTMSGPGSTGRPIEYPTISAQLSMFNPWCSATKVIIRVQAWPSHGIPPAERRSSTVSF